MQDQVSDGGIREPKTEAPIKRWDFLGTVGPAQGSKSMSNFSRFGLLMAVATTALLAGCKHSQQDTSRPGEQPKPPSGSTLAIAGRMLDGADQATIRTY